MQTKTQEVYLPEKKKKKTSPRCTYTTSKWMTAFYNTLKQFLNFVTDVAIYLTLCKEKNSNEDTLSKILILNVNDCTQNMMHRM